MCHCTLLYDMYMYIQVLQLRIHMKCQEGRQGDEEYRGRQYGVTSGLKEESNYNKFSGIEITIS